MKMTTTEQKLITLGL